ncbi:hypothetical protein CPB85DRAFT_1270290 [Mucidula mucida]|nr:hypothetical protein CPB85DRAFT_1270290 [Mucidula mucida]
MSDAAWDSLLQWLRTKGMDTSCDGLLVERRKCAGAGYGLFTLKACSPSSLLFSVPAEALLNAKTLSPLYPRAGLSATQLISMHLTLHRPSFGKPDPQFGPYISVLPADFSFHPLVWMVQKHCLEAELLQYLPPSVSRAMQKLSLRFDVDLKAVRRYLTEDAENLNMLENNFLWGWLNVNTRGIYLRLKSKQSDPDNLTLCPILDMANHSSHLPHMSPRPSKAHGGPSLRGMSFISPSEVHLDVDREVFLKYGSHGNRLLFTEYGFSISTESIKAGEMDGEVDISDILEELLDSSYLKRALEAENYWGDWTLHVTRESAYPSFRVLAALRLYHLAQESATDDDVSAWKDTLAGRRDVVSPDNETAVRATLDRICCQLVERGEQALESIEKVQSKKEVRSNVKVLWTEEILVGRAVSVSIRSGAVF